MDRLIKLVLIFLILPTALYADNLVMKAGLYTFTDSKTVFYCFPSEPLGFKCLKTEK